MPGDIYDNTEGPGNFYVNANAVSFTWIADETVNITHYHPGEFDEKEAELEYCLIVEGHRRLKELLGIDMDAGDKAIDQANAITLEHLVELYQRGIASMECSIENGEGYYSLYFYKTAGGGMKVWSDMDEPEDEKPLPYEFIRPEEFIKYTQQSLLALKHP